MNMASMLDSSEPIQLSSRFAKLKRNMIACREKDVAESFYRLLRAIRREADDIAARGSDVIPTIDYFDIHDREKAAHFRKELRRTGVAVIKRVVPHTVAEAWKEETLEYIADNPHEKGYSSQDPQFLDMYWSPSQVRARADSRLLDAQRFAMGTWHASDENALVSADHPVVYADRVRVRTPDDASPAGSIHVDNGSVERWEPDGYGASRTYSTVFSGRWEDYDPWDSSPRLNITTDLYNRSGSCSMFRMFQGFLSLSEHPAGSGALTVCPMLQLSTAYLLLRPFFTPRYKSPAGDMDIDMDMGGMGMGGTKKKKTELDFLHPNNWNMNVSQTSVLHGAVPGYVQELSDGLHPHLQLHRTMVSVPDLEPGDYVIWHPDVVHAIDAAQPGVSSLINASLSPTPSYAPLTSSSSSLSTASSLSYPHIHSHSHAHSHVHPHLHTSPSTALYIPACPLTQTNALYLARQRRAFLLGLAAPDFSAAGSKAASEHDHASRAGVQDVADAGGERALRGMGLAPWEQETHSHSHSHSHSHTRSHSHHSLRHHERENSSGAGKEREAALVRLANGILFPDRFDGVLKKGGGKSGKAGKGGGAGGQ
ncbi:hypothetical protein F4777DRAFT_593060 [Nemania sp. FL0916]|nr:hypothetical protein F4777DRAFT_593060 [Nemania sp. FL0916]